MPFKFIVSLILTIVSFVPVVSTASICGQVGVHNSSMLTSYMGNFFWHGISTFALCAAFCKKDATKCKSFRYSYWADADSQYCEFFDNGLDGNFTADSTEPYYYYDVACAFPPFVDPITISLGLNLGLPLATSVQTVWTVQTVSAVQTVWDIQTVSSSQTVWVIQTVTAVQTITTTPLVPALDAGQARTITVTSSISGAPVTIVSSVPGPRVTITSSVLVAPVTITTSVPGPRVTIILSAPGTTVTTTLIVPGARVLVTSTVPGTTVTTTLIVPGVRTTVTTTYIVPGVRTTVTTTYIVPGVQTTITSSAPGRTLTILSITPGMTVTSTQLQISTQIYVVTTTISACTRTSTAIILRPTTFYETRTATRSFTLTLRGER